MKDKRFSFKQMIIFALILCFLTNCSALNANTAPDVLPPEKSPIAEPLNVSIKVNTGEIINCNAYVIDHWIFIVESVPKESLPVFLILRNEDDGYKEVAKAVFLYYDETTKYSVFISNTKMNNTSENNVPEKAKQLVGEIKDSLFSEIFKYQSKNFNDKSPSTQNNL